MQPQKKKSHTVVLLIGWLIILGSYLLIRLAFILFWTSFEIRSVGSLPCRNTVPFSRAVFWKIRQITKGLVLLVGHSIPVHC